MEIAVKKKRRGLFYSKEEERINAISHAAGIALGLIVCICFLAYCHQHGDGWATLGVWLYFVGMGGSYLTSTLYHTLRHHNPLKKKLRQWDHAAIY